MSKATKFFWNLEKQRGNQNRILKLIANEKEINNETEILNQIKLFCETLFQKSSQKHSADDIYHFLNTLDILKLSIDEIIFCDIELTEKDVYDSMKARKMINLQETMLSISQREAIIKLKEKNVNGFRKTRYFRCLTEFWICLRVYQRVF